MVAQACTPPKPAKKGKAEHKKYKKRQHPEEDEPEVLEFVEDEEEDTQLEVIPPGGQISSGILTSEKNWIRENIVKTKLVRKGQLFHLPICSIQRPPIDPEIGRQALEIREPHSVHVQNLCYRLLSITNLARAINVLHANREEHCQTLNNRLCDEGKFCEHITQTCISFLAEALLFQI